jgi:hypothetical protein
MPDSISGGESFAQINLNLTKLTTLFEERTNNWSSDISANRSNIGEAFKRIGDVERSIIAMQELARAQADKILILESKFVDLDKILQKTRESLIRISAITSLFSSVSTGVVLKFFLGS